MDVLALPFDLLLLLPLLVPVVLLLLLLPLAAMSRKG